MAVMNYKQTNRYPDGTGMLLDTTPGTPDSGSYTTETQLKQWTNAEIISGSQVVGKAQKDQNGNVIDATYATKAELNADVATLQSQIDRNKAEIENLKQTTKQDEQTVSYPDDGNYSSIMPNGVPASVAKYGEVAGIRGKSRGWNQLANPANNNSSIIGAGEINGITVTYDSTTNKYHVQGTANASYDKAIVTSLPHIGGHKYLIYASGIATGHTASTRLYIYGSGVFSNLWNGTADTASNSGNANIYLYINTGTSVNFDFQIVERDLTAIFPEGVPATVADCVKAIPDLLKWDTYDAGSLVDTTVTGVEASVPYDGWDNLMENGYISQGTGQNVGDDSNYKRSANYVPVTPSTKYRMRYPSYGGVILYYGSDKTYLGSGSLAGSSYEFVTGNNVYYIRFWFNYWQTYNNDIYVSDFVSLMLSTPVTLKSAGSVAEVLTLETGKKTRPIGSGLLFDDVGTGWNWDSGKSLWFLDSVHISNILAKFKVPTSYDDKADIIVEGYTVYSNNDFYNNDVPDKGIGIAPTGLVWFKDLSINAPTYNGCMAVIQTLTGNFALATPLSDEQVCDPIIDNYIEVEAGGTINTIQSQSPVIDNCLDVTYDFIPA